MERRGCMERTRNNAWWVVWIYKSSQKVMANSKTNRVKTSNSKTDTWSLHVRSMVDFRRESSSLLKVGKDNTICSLKVPHGTITLRSTWELWWASRNSLRQISLLQRALFKGKSTLSIAKKSLITIHLSDKPSPLRKRLGSVNHVVRCSYILITRLCFITRHPLPMSNQLDRHEASSFSVSHPLTWVRCPFDTKRCIIASNRFLFLFMRSVRKIDVTDRLLVGNALWTECSKSLEALALCM